MRNAQTLKLHKIIFIALCVWLSACSTEQKVVIISTNDIHAAIDKFPYLASTVERIREQNPGEVVLVDAGDRWTGNPFVDLATPPFYPIIALMDSLGYDVGTFGNHEFDKGVDTLAQRVKDMTFELTCANLNSGQTSLPQPAPYVFKEVNGVKLCFVGLVTNFINGHPDGKDESFEGLTFYSPFETAEAFSSLKDSCDVLIGLTHIGDDMDSVLAVRVPQFDLILGGHSHTVIDTPRKYGDVVVTQTGSKLKYVGITTLTLENGRLKHIDNRLIPLDTVPSPKFQAMVDSFNDNPVLNAPIGSTGEEMTRSGVVNMITDAVRRSTGSDIAFYHSGGIRVDALAKGGVSTADMFRIDPFASEIYLVRMTERDIESLIVNKFNDTANPKESHCIDLNPSGANYTVITDEAGQAVGIEFHPDKKRETYTVAMPDYVYKIYRFDKGADAEPTGLLVTGILKEMFGSRSPVMPDDTPRADIKRKPAA